MSLCSYTAPNMLIRETTYQYTFLDVFVKCYFINLLKQCLNQTLYINDHQPLPNSENYSLLM